MLLPRKRDSVSSMTTKNPFPGMNPFFEQRWRDARSSLITYLRDALQDKALREGSLWKIVAPAVLILPAASRQGKAQETARRRSE